MRDMMRHRRGNARLVRRRRHQVRTSRIHGRGVFARRRIAAGEPIIEYGGELVPWVEADEGADGHTMLFDVGDGLVIDGGRGGNEARWINHGCEPNCEAFIDGRRIEIHALRDIAKGEELLLDYQLQVEGDDVASYACRCGAASCRSTMVSTTAWGE
jgi:SET domain-containing protein